LSDVEQLHTEAFYTISINTGLPTKYMHTCIRGCAFQIWTRTSATL